MSMAETVPRVRIPLPPPHSLGCREIELHYCKNSVKIAAIPQVLHSNGTGESVPSNPAARFSGVFLWTAHAQSGFSNSIERMQCDHKPMMRRKRLDFVSIWETPFFPTTTLFVGSFRLDDNPLVCPGNDHEGVSRDQSDGLAITSG